MRVLGGEGLVELDAQGRYLLTEIGHELRAGRMREVARFVGVPFMWNPWTRLTDGLRSDAQASAFELSMGAPLFEFLDDHPEEAEIYHRSVDAFTRREARALAGAFDFSQYRSVVDVGGGLGVLLAELCAVWPNLSHCTLFDRPNVIEQARAGAVASQLGERLALVQGDFLERIPVQAEVFVVKHVLHNWQDEHAATILRNCREGLAPGGRILVVEGILLPGLMLDQTTWLDLEMFVLCGEGRERTKPEFRKLFSDAGLRLLSTADLAGTTRLLVAEAR